MSSDEKGERRWASGDFDISRVTGIGEFFEEERVTGKGDEKIKIFKVSEDGKAFLVVRKNTVEIRTDGRLSILLRERYESVMESRYFGRGGIEIVLSGQIPLGEIYDLVRLSYDMTKKLIFS